MLALTGKRSRNSTETAPVQESPFNAAATRAALKCRLEETPLVWRHVKSATGSSGIDECVRFLGRAVAEASEAVPQFAEAVRVKLREARLVIHAAVDARFDELEHRVDAAEAAKLAALEYELVAVDVTLELWRSVSAAVMTTAAALSDPELKTQHSALSSRLDDMEAQLQALPTAVVEPPFVGMVADTPALLAAIACFGRVLAPLAIRAADLSLRGAPSFVQPGETLCLHLSLGACHAAQSAEEIAVSLSRLAGMTVIDAVFDAPGVEEESLASTLSCHAAARSMHISMGIPATASVGDRVVVRAVAVAGLLAKAALCLPVRKIMRGMLTPLWLFDSVYESSLTPCISRDGRLFVPIGRCDVFVFDAEGAEMPIINLPCAHLKHNTKWAAYAPGDAPSLLLADSQTGPCRIVSLDMVTFAVQWSVESGTMGCGGIATLPAQGVAVINGRDTLFIHRLADGARLGSDHIFSDSVMPLGRFLAADLASGIVFCTVKNYAPGGHAVCSWSCAADGSKLIRQGPVTAAGVRAVSRPLAVVPPVPGKRTSHLVVGTHGSSELLVLSLPDLILVHTHNLERAGHEEGDSPMDVAGLAADPWGGALAVCDAASEAIHVIAWPLPGMLPLL